MPKLNPEDRELLHDLVQIYALSFAAKPHKMTELMGSFDTLADFVASLVNADRESSEPEFFYTVRASEFGPMLTSTHTTTRTGAPIRSLDHAKQLATEYLAEHPRAETSYGVQYRTEPITEEV